MEVTLLYIHSLKPELVDTHPPPLPSPFLAHSSPLQEGILNEVSEFHEFNKSCHEDGNQEESITLDEEVEVALPKGTSKILWRRLLAHELFINAHVRGEGGSGIVQSDLKHIVLTSVFKERPLLKNITDTAMYFTVKAGYNGPSQKAKNHLCIHAMK